MFEKEIKFIADYTLNNVNRLGGSFTFEKLLNSEIHPAVTQYLNAELDYLMYEDRKKLLAKSVFDYTGAAAAKYFKLMGDEIKKTKRVSFDEIKKIVIQAVSFNVNFTARPRWSLVKLMFNENDNRPAADIIQMLDTIYYYDYFRKIITAYLNKKNIQQLHPAEFESLLGKIDNELFSNRKEELVENALYAMADFHNEGGTGKTKIYSQSVEVFLKEKNLIDQLFKLRRALPPEKKQRYEVEDILNILFRDKSVSKETIIPPPVPEVNRQPDISKNTAAAEPPAHNAPAGIFPQSQEEPESYNEPAAQNKNTADEEDMLAFYDSQLKSLEEEADIISSELQQLAERELPPEEITDEETPQEEEITEEKTPQEEEEDYNRLLEEEDISDTGDEEFLMEEENPDENEREFEDDDFEIDYEDDDIEETIDKAADDLYTPDAGRNTRSNRVFNKDLFSFLSDKEIDRIVSSVFNEDRDDFTGIMERISESSDYKEATEILKRVFSSYNVNPYSKDAVVLTNAVSNYFNQD